MHGITRITTRFASRITALLACLLLGLVLAPGCGEASGGEIVKVYRSPTCGCCGKWIDLLKADGFKVEVTEIANVKPVKEANGVPLELSSCHTALVGGYVVEGHVPISDIRRLLKERPDIDGIAVPGMPRGSPGMEGPRPVVYDVVSFDKGTKVGVYATHQGVSSMP